MRSWFRQSKRPTALLREVASLKRQILDLQAELEAERRTSAVKQAEIESLAAVIARDRERIKAEAAAYARERADSEGRLNVRRTA